MTDIQGMDVKSNNTKTWIKKNHLFRYESITSCEWGLWWSSGVLAMVARQSDVPQPVSLKRWIETRALFILWQNILPTVTPHFWWRHTPHSSRIFCWALQQNILQVTNAPHVAWCYSGLQKLLVVTLHLPFSEIFVDRQFSMLILNHSFVFTSFHIPTLPETTLSSH